MGLLEPTVPRDAASEDIRAYLLHCLEIGRSRSYMDQTISALRLLYMPRRSAAQASSAS